jgi:hypothetical protein
MQAQTRSQRCRESTNCPGCSAHRFRDYKITTSFSRTIRTRGDVVFDHQGRSQQYQRDLYTAIIEGKLRGNLECEDSMTINLVGKFPAIGAQHIVVERNPTSMLSARAGDEHRDQGAHVG